MELLSYESLIRRLKELDEEASLRFDSADRLSLIIVGGSALILMEYISRATHDIDAMEASQQLQDLLQDYDINMNVQTYLLEFQSRYFMIMCVHEIWIESHMGFICPKIPGWMPCICFICDLNKQYFHMKQLYFFTI